MLNDLKNFAAQQVGRVLTSDATQRVLSNQQVQTLMLRAINLRAESRDLVERRVQGVASALDLVTRDDITALKRTIRALEDTIDDLREELIEAQEKARAQALAEADAAAAAASTEPGEAEAARKPARTRKKSGRAAKAGGSAA